MGFFRKATIQKEKIDTSKPLATAVRDVVEVAGNGRALTAKEAADFAFASIRSYGKDARLFLILADEVRRDGTSFEWQFHVLFPLLHCDGIFRVTRTDDHQRSVISYTVTPVPEPGSTEYFLAQVSPQIAADQATAWQDRLALIVPLPERFTDTAVVTAALDSLQTHLFASGPIRLKARRLPTGLTVWETKGVDLIHVPFSDSSEPTAMIAPQYLES